MKKIFLILIYLIFKYTYSNAQIITTIAGNGTNGYSGDNGPALLAELNLPCNVIVDAKGNLLISDQNSNCIRKVNTSGIITTIVGTGVAGYNGDGIMATAAQLNGGICSAIDRYGNLYIADVINYRIRKIDTFGIIQTIAGNGGVGFSGDNGPATDAEMNQPTCVAVDSLGDVYIADGFNNRIRMVNTLGVITTIAGTGTAGYSGEGGPATSAEITLPEMVILDGLGNIYFSDFYRIRKINSSGIITTVAGNNISGYNGDGIPATAAQLNNPVGLAISNTGVIYFTDVFNYRVRKIDTNGIITTIAGNGTAGFSGDGGPADSAELNSPDGICIDGSGDIIFTDFANNRVRKITYTNGVPVVGGRGADVKVYPNPTNRKLHFEFPISNDVTIKLMDITGRLMEEQTVHNNPGATFDVSGYTPGIYLYEVITANKTQTGKIIVESNKP